VETERTLLCLALNDEPSVRSALTVEPDPGTGCALDPRTQALVRLGVFVALDAAPASYGWSVDAALAAGATIDEIVGTLLAVAPVVGSARVVAAAPSLAEALGYDIDAALERIESSIADARCFQKRPPGPQP
jgi:alkylhydroperoxidase/carboxymuconolactone decarboxylase family protein YurZ